MTTAGWPRPPDLTDDPHVVWAHDRRSVGELLRDADHLARDLLLDLDGDQAAALLRTWGETVQAAAELWRSLPTPTPDAQGRADAEILTRLQAHAQRMHRRQLSMGWPGDGPADERLLRIAETFTRAASLVDRFHTQPPRPGLLAVVRADVLAARTRVIHTLHVASHGTGLAVRQHVQNELRRTHGSRDLRETRAVPRGTEALRRLEVFERLAGAYVGRGFVAAAEGEHQLQMNGVERLHSALVRWDIHAHRVTAYAPAPANLALVAATQAYIGTATFAVIRAGAETGELDPSIRVRAEPALEATQAAWADVAAQWRRLTDASTARTDPDLRATAAEVRAALLEITHHTTSPASTAEAAARADLPEAAHSLQQALTAAADLALHLQDTAPQTNANVPARSALAAYLAADATVFEGEPRPNHGHLGTLASPVDPRALRHNDLVPLPPPVAARIGAAIDLTVNAAATAMSATSGLDHSGQAGAGAGADREPPPVGRRLVDVHVQTKLPLPEPGWAR